MLRFGFWRSMALTTVVCFVACPGGARQKELSAVRWTKDAPGCTFERGDDGRYRWIMAGKDLTVTLLVDSQELTKSRRRFYHLLGMYVDVAYVGSSKYEFPADVRIEFIKHHNFREAYEDPGEVANKLQNDVDTLVFETERKIKKNPSISDAKTAELREYQKDASEFIDFLSAQTLQPIGQTLTPGNADAHGWVFFSTSNRWIGPLAEHEEFIVSLYMKDKIWQFPVSLPPTSGDLILRKPVE